MMVRHLGGTWFRSQSVPVPWAVVVVVVVSVGSDVRGVEYSTVRYRVLCVIHVLYSSVLYTTDESSTAGRGKASDHGKTHSCGCWLFLDALGRRIG
jgi:hypothetical protein